MAGKTKDADFTNQPKYDGSGKGLDYGGATEYEIPALEKAEEQGYFGDAPGGELDGDLTVAGVAGRDVVAEQKGASGFKAGDGGDEA